MIPARTPDPINTPLKAYPEEPQDTSGGSLWPSFNFHWVFTIQIPNSLFLASTEDLRCSPRSYSQEIAELNLQSDLQVRTAYLKKALDTIPLNILQSSIYFWGHDNFDIVCNL